MKRFTYLALMALLLFSCTRNNTETKKANSVIADVALSNGEEKKADKQATADSTVTHESNTPETANNKPKPMDWDKKIIKIANVTLELKAFTNYNTNIHQSLKNYGAYIAQEEQTQNDATIENTITIKVPVEKFEDLMNTFSGDGIKVLERKITTEDVTAEVVDTKGRIETKKQVRQQYMELLKQAKNMKDILDVQNEINSITEEVESAGSRVKYLVHQSTYSTIHLKYFQYSNGVKPVEEQPNFFTKIKEAFKSGGTAVANLLIFLTNIWPFILLLIVGWLGAKKWSKKKSASKENSAV